MKTILKYALWTLFGILTTVSTVLAYVALTFDPNAYKPQIIQAVQQATHRTLQLDGDIKLMFFPSVGAHLGQIALSDRDSERGFVSVADARVSLAVWPLLSKKLVVNEVHVSGVDVHIIKYKDGKTNLEDLLASAGNTVSESSTATQPSAVSFDVASVLVENCSLQFEDHTSGNTVSITDMNLKTGRLTNGSATPLQFSAQVKSTVPAASIGLHMATTLMVDMANERFTLKGTELDMGGGLLDISGMKLKLAGEASADVQAQHYELNLFVVNASGKKSGETFDVQLTIPTVKLDKDEFNGQNLMFKANFAGEFGKATASVTLPSINGNLDKFNLQGLAVQAGLVQQKQAINAQIDASLIGSLKTQQFNLKDISVALKATGDSLPGKMLESVLKGGIQADLERQSVHAKFAGGILQSHIKLEAALKNFKVPVIRYDIEADKVDLDPYLPETSVQPASGKPAQAEQPFDLSALNAIEASGSVRIGAFKVANVQLEKVHAGMKLRKGQLELAPLSAKLYQGMLSGAASVDSNNYRFSTTQKLKGVEIAPLLKDAADLELAEGRGTVTLAVSTEGHTVSALKKSLNGTAAFDLADGAIRGVDLSKLVQGVQNLNKDSKAETLGIDKKEKTPFSEFRATFKIKDGVAYNADLSAKSTVLRLSGRGNVDIGHDKMDYNAKVVMAKTEQGNTGTLPVHVFGPFDALKIKVDYAALFADIARQRLNEEKAALKKKLTAKKNAAQAGAKAKLDAEKAAAKAKLEDKLKQGLKGLFK